jgi:hypothetical protein
MTRLIDESTDELTRSLLVAGIEHRPGPGNKARVIVALGAGSALGLFSSNAFAWLGTTAGKLTAVGLTVGVAGAVFIAAPRLVRDEPVRTAQSSSIATDRREHPFQDPPRSGSPPALPARVPAGGSLVDEAVGRASTSSAVSDPGESHVSGSPIPESPIPESTASASGKTAAKKLSLWRERRLTARRKVQSHETERAPDEPAVLAAAKPTPVLGTPPAGELDPRGVGQPLADSPTMDPVQEKADLDSEVKLVDEMHWAARHNDREALGRFVEQYRETFPDGQLKKEVAQFAARLERSEPPRSR